jgi:tetratricopeptide (TPR) repeat protein
MSKTNLERSPDSVFDLYFQGRIQQIKGSASDAVKLFNRCLEVQKEYVSLQSVATWDLLWCHALRGDWRKASECAKFLEKNCNWSKATNLFQWACFQYMIMEEQDKPELLDDITDAMRKVPELRKRYVGKTVPPEKFAITKAAQFLDGKKLHLPAYELFYMWNIFGNTGGRQELLDPILNRINKKIEVLEKEYDESLYVMLLLKGVCLRNYGRHEEAIECFQQILKSEEEIKKLNYVAPQAAMEIGLAYLTIGKISDAREWLHRARDDYTGFMYESLAHLRIHGALLQIKYHAS